MTKAKQKKKIVYFKTRESWWKKCFLFRLLSKRHNGNLKKVVNLFAYIFQKSDTVLLFAFYVFPRRQYVRSIDIIQ